ncbi:esterase/lipase family protein [Demequina sp. SO4-18]|uniref:esterase/lipase family protein n=1 Tax=Demequina sp. SO4-18 TaxID=3401026 RepID=UPI003B5BFC25
MRDLVRFGMWWALDYGYAVVWQARSFFSRARSDSYLSGSRRPVVILPGIYETWKFMRPLIEQLHAQGHPVHVVADLRRNHAPVPDVAEHVAAYLEANDLDDVIVVAHSKGGLAGKLVMTGPAGDRIRGMLAIAVPFGGSRYARLMPLRSLRAFSSRDPSIVNLAQHASVNARIVSVYARFDPHIPGGSELPGATNALLDTGGHFRILGHPAVLAKLATFTS